MSADAIRLVIIHRLTDNPIWRSLRFCFANAEAIFNFFSSLANANKDATENPAVRAPNTNEGAFRRHHSVSSFSNRITRFKLPFSVSVEKFKSLSKYYPSTMKMNGTATMPIFCAVLLL